MDFFDDWEDDGGSPGGGGGGASAGGGAAARAIVSEEGRNAARTRAEATGVGGSEGGSDGAAACGIVVSAGEGRDAGRRRPEGRENSAPRRQRSFGPRDVIIGGEDADVRVRRALRCLKCDFEVARFANSRWSADASYVFFRNYAGTPSELRRELESARGVAAYCCQCAWQSVGREPKLIAKFGTPAGSEGGSVVHDTIHWVRS